MQETLKKNIFAEFSLLHINLEKKENPSLNESKPQKQQNSGSSCCSCSEYDMKKVCDCCCDDDACDACCDDDNHNGICDLCECFDCN